jgi:ethanolamine utilization cobalamin adenosyltransferase
MDEEKNSKLEHMTNLLGSEMVAKDDALIVFRGELDSAYALCVMCQVCARKEKHDALVGHLSDILRSIRSVMRAHVNNEKVPPLSVMGMDEDGIREASHHPDKCLGVTHFMPDWRMGETMAWLNILRTQLRSGESAAVAAYIHGDTPERTDILTAMNRLSSAAYVLMCQLNAGIYG